VSQNRAAVHKKVMKAIAGGMSRRQAAARFDIGPGTAVRWAKQVETTGDVAPLRMGCDRRSQRIEAHADFILARIAEKPDMTIMELREKSGSATASGFGYGTVVRFLARTTSRARRRRAMRRSRKETTSRPSARLGSRESSISIL